MNSAFYLLPAAFLLLFFLERLFPLRKPKSRLVSRLLVNAIVSGIAVAVALALVRPIAMRVLQLASENDWGLANAIAMHPVVQAVVVFLLMDLSFYYWHRVNHTWPLLWRFHVAHHIDPDLDVTTALRFHFVEIAYSSAFRALQVIVVGSPVWMFVTYEAIFQLNTYLQHSNLRLPIRFERWLSLVIVTPRMHGIHHSRRFDETNSNWSTVFSFWDRLHGTLRLNVPQSRVDIGISGYSVPEDNTIGAVLAMPFRKQRSYWDEGVGRSISSRDRNGDRPSQMAE
jgi:sterol desaturase/sphingolipid hydroxylase (fatty acid hydroxylase superfamily)